MSVTFWRCMLFGGLLEFQCLQAIWRSRTPRCASHSVPFKTKHKPPNFMGLLFIENWTMSAVAHVWVPICQKKSALFSIDVLVVFFIPRARGLYAEWQYYFSYHCFSTFALLAHALGNIFSPLSLSQSGLIAEVTVSYIVLLYFSDNSFRIFVFFFRLVKVSGSSRSMQLSFLVQTIIAER